VYNGRAEAFLEKEAFDFTISRALSDLKTFCSLSFPLLKKGRPFGRDEGKRNSLRRSRTKKS